MEAEALATLRAEFVENVARIDSTETVNSGLRAGMFQMLIAIRERGVPAGSYIVPDSILTKVGGIPSFRPARGALASLLGSQGLVLIQDDSLRAALASLPGRVDDLEAGQQQLIAANEERLVPILHRYVAYVSVDYRAGVYDGLEGPGRFDSDFESLLEDLELENWIDYQLLRLDHWSDRLEEARAEARWIVARIDAVGGR